MRAAAAAPMTIMPDWTERQTRASSGRVDAARRPQSHAFCRAGRAAAMRCELSGLVPADLTGDRRWASRLRPGSARKRASREPHPHPLACISARAVRTYSMPVRLMASCLCLSRCLSTGLSPVPTRWAQETIHNYRCSLQSWCILFLVCPVHSHWDSPVIILVPESVGVEFA